MIGLIGGTGVYDAKLLEDVEQVEVNTKFGKPASKLIMGKLKEKKLVILPRHGPKHSFNPTKVPYRANLWAMKELGVTKLISVSAVGSLKEDLKPGDFVFTDQFIDRTTKRNQTFYDKEQVCHIGVAEPFCVKLRNNLIKVAAALNYDFHDKGTCVVIEGPRFSTKAESLLYKSWNADTVNMTLVPEVILAREAEICYANISMVTDYDVWRDSHVSNEEVLRTMKKNIDKVRKLLMTVIPMIDEKPCSCNKALKSAMM